MPKMFFEGANCRGATSGVSGRHYDADRQGFIHVDNSADVANLKSGGYLQAGGMPKLAKYWVCDSCSWEASINHCSKCGSESLTKVER